MSYQLARRLFTVDDFERMCETGILREDDRVELIEGEITQMAALGKRHASCVDVLNDSLTEQSRRRYIVRVQSSIRLHDLSSPQPDIALLVRRKDFYRHQLPSAADVLLVIEVSDSSLEYDRRKKLPDYARAGMPEFWIVNLIEDRIEIYTQPTGGTYERVAYVEPGEALSSVTIPDLTLDSAALLA